MISNSFHIGQRVEIYDHSEPTYNGEWGTILNTEMVREAVFITVETDAGQIITCTPDELIEG